MQSYTYMNNIIIVSPMYQPAYYYYYLLYYHCYMYCNTESCMMTFLFACIVWHPMPTH